MLADSPVNASCCSGSERTSAVHHVASVTNVMAGVEDGMNGEKGRKRPKFVAVGRVQRSRRNALGRGFLRISCFSVTKSEQEVVSGGAAGYQMPKVEIE